MSIVLLIVGLLVGGILIGQDIIKSSETEAQITQIQKYNSAVNAFQNKYGGLPGDLASTLASQFGFAPRGTSTGQGNGDDVLEGCNGLGWSDGCGETAVFWEDLSAAGLIDQTFNTASETTLSGSDVTGAAIGQYLPNAKIGNGNYIYVWNTNSNQPLSYLNNYPDNYFGISAVTGILNSTHNGQIVSNFGITVNQAYAIDSKIDDGLPLSGNVIAAGLGAPFSDAGDPAFHVYNGVGGVLADLIHAPLNVTSGYSPTPQNCMDNSGSASNTMQYSFNKAGNNPNCVLSIKFQ